MAKGISKNDGIEEIVQEKAETRKSISEKKESSYSVKELAVNARKLFGTRPECVTAALTAAGKTESTVIEAKSIVENFLKREVK